MSACPPVPPVPPVDASGVPLALAVGRVHFHLAENKGDERAPFAFLATYAARLSKQARLQHTPLGRAVASSAGAGDRKLLLELLRPVQEAAEKSAFLKALFEHWKRVEGQAAREGLSFLEGMRLLSGAALGGGESAAEASATAAWSKAALSAARRRPCGALEDGGRGRARRHAEGGEKEGAERGSGERVRDRARAGGGEGWGSRRAEEICVDTRWAPPIALKCTCTSGRTS